MFLYRPSAANLSAGIKYCRSVIQWGHHVNPVELLVWLYIPIAIADKK